MPSISVLDRESRFIPEHPNNASFTRLLVNLGITLPSGHTLQDMVRWGWLEPSVRLPLPAPFVQQWRAFPTLGLARQIRAEDEPLDLLWSRAFIAWPEVPGSRCTAEWWTHPFENAAYPLGRPTVLAPYVHAMKIGAGPGCEEPVPIALETGDEVQGWLDFFQGWQAFEVHDLLHAATLHVSLMNKPTAGLRAETFVPRLEGLRRYSDAWIERARSDWRHRRTAFEHVYRYRTLLGIWLGRKGTLTQRQRGARGLARMLGITAASLRDEIRDVLLVAWKHLSGLPDAATEQFRADIALAVDWLSILEGRPVYAYEPFWSPADLQPRDWEYLSEVLPYELDEARHEFARWAVPYLERYNTSASMRRRYDEERIAGILDRHWKDRYSLRRFCLAFARLHKHYGGAVNRGKGVRLVAASPIDFLVLSTLYAEKLQAELFLSGRRKVLDPFQALILGRARAIGVAERLPDLEPMVRRRWKKETGLHHITVTRRTPFRRARKRSRTLYLADSLLNFAKLRNYAAHHDILDWKLLNTSAGGPAIEALVLAVLLTLES